jgi:3-polyprenyl-4-hydroxybenzoate decarboxylase
MPLDPGSDPPGMSCKVILDCTTPVPPEPPMRDVAMVEHVPEAGAYAGILLELQKAQGR